MIPRSRGTVVIASAAILAMGAGTGAVAADMITSNEIANKSIQSVDLAPSVVNSNKIKDGTVRYKDLHASLQGKVNGRDGANGANGTNGANGANGAKGDNGTNGAKGDNGTNGAKGDNGANGTNGTDGAAGAKGDKGDTGSAEYVGAHWSIIDRNLIGNGDAFLRSGPFVGFGATTGHEPPMGVGSLGIRTGAPTDKAAFGNEVDFFGQALSTVSGVSFWEYTTGENVKISPANLASVSFEINPNDTTSTYSTLNYVAPAIPANRWTQINTTDKSWYLTGAAGASTGCNQNTYCTLDEVKTKLPTATLLSVQLSKGRDYAFSGAVDALQIGSTVYDFEPFGVIATPIP